MILSLFTFNIGFAEYTTVATYAGWTTVDIPGVMRFQIPPTMEIQSEGYKKKTEQIGGNTYEFMKALKAYTTLQFVANQKGLNAGTKFGFGHYSRVLADMIPASGAFGSGHRLNLTKKELTELRPIMAANIKQGYSLDPRWHFTMNYFSPIVVQNISGKDCLTFAYIRTLDNKPPVVVHCFNFYGKKHDLNFQISYRITERNIWEYPGNDLRDVLNTVYFYGDL